MEEEKKMAAPHIEIKLQPDFVSDLSRMFKCQTKAIFERELGSWIAPMKVQASYPPLDKELVKGS